MSFYLDRKPLNIFFASAQYCASYSLFKVLLISFLLFGTAGKTAGICKAAAQQIATTAKTHPQHLPSLLRRVRNNTLVCMYLWLASWQDD